MGAECGAECAEKRAVMSDQFAPRSDPQGEYTRTCPACGQEFRTDNPRAKYCTYECRRQAQNRRHYEAHRKDIIAAVIERRKQQQDDPAQ